jgi:cytochrome c
MSKYHKFGVAAALTLALVGPAVSQPLGLGRAALPQEIAAWDKDVRPDGLGLPPGSGSVEDGEVIFTDNCAICHGDFAEGVGNWPKLAGGADTLDREDPVKTVGSYWPYLSTTWDYVNRTMPFGNAQTLKPDEVYAIVAYILYSNDLVEEDFVLSDQNFLSIEMPNRDGFMVDDRAETEFPTFREPPCMENCKDNVEITMRARVLDVTPEAEDKAEAPAAEAQVVAEIAPAKAAPDPALIAAGEKVFKKCKSCHQVGDNAKNRTGPALNGIIGRLAAASDGFRYSKAFTKLAGDGVHWDEANLAEFLSDPKGFAKGTRMSFRGLKKPGDIAAVTAYLASFTE